MATSNNITTMLHTEIESPPGKKRILEITRRIITASIRGYSYLFVNLNRP